MVNMFNKIINKTSLILSSFKKVLKVKYKKNTMLFVNSSNLTNYRIKTFSQKEPDTLDWIDSFSENSCLWDIGANIGLYSIYASKSKNCKVYAFEPSIFNLQILAKNIFLNSLQKNICVIPLAASNSSGEGKFNMSNTNIGHANSSFGTNLGFDGKPFKVKFEYSTVSIKLNDAINIFNIKFPDYIKIDVDGIEHLVLSGGIEILKNAKEILIELPGVWDEQTNTSNKLLIESGHTLVKDHKFDPVTNPTSVANQIWKRL